MATKKKEESKQASSKTTSTDVKKSESKSTNSTKNTTSDVKNRLAEAYTNSKPEVTTYDDGASLSVGGNRVGGVNNYSNNNGQNYYGAYLDNTGSPYRGVSDNSINTPMGSLDYGYDGDTSYVGYTSPIARNSGTLDDGRTYATAQYVNPMNDNVSAYAQRFGNTYSAGIDTPLNMGAIGEREVNTPLGTFGVEGGVDTPNSLAGYYTPNQGGYIDRLLNAINGNYRNRR